MNRPVDTIEHAIESVEEAVESVEEAVESALPGPRSLWRRVIGVLGWFFVILYFLLALLILGLRYWVMPNISQYTQDIAAEISKKAGERVTIGQIDTGWQGLRPYLELADVRIHDRQGQVALTLPSVNATVSLLPLLLFDLHFYSIELAAPSLNIRRDAAGKLYIAGIQLKRESSGNGGFADWVLAQREVIIRDAHISWEDGLRGAPRLELANVAFRLSNRSHRHRFALTAKPPAELASALDLRGELVGSTVAQLQEWNGRFYAEFDYTNLVAWRPWVDYPLEVQRGAGGLRMWLSFAENKLTEAVADVALAGVATRLSPELPLLELEEMQGRIGVRDTEGAFTVFGRKVAMKSSTGVTLQPADFSLTLDAARPGEQRMTELQVGTLDLPPLIWLVDYLPVPQDARKLLAETEPQGSLHDLKLTWTGEPQHPEQYSVRGRFEHLGMKAYRGLPRFSGLSGNIDGSGLAGALSLNTEKLTLDLPGGILSDPHLVLDTLTGQISWGHQRDDKLEVRVANLSAANRDFAGSGYGSWQPEAQGPGSVDLTARLVRADGKAAPRYLPPVVGEAALTWLKRALITGQSTDVRVRLRGNLQEFPWSDERGGQFQVTAKIQGGSLDYVEGWPGISDITADLLFEGKRMSVSGSHAVMLGAKLSGVRVMIPDLLSEEKLLQIEGKAEGPTAEFLKFIRESPVDGMIGNVSDIVSSRGNGRLQLKLDLPLQHPDESKLAGTYQFLSNQLQFGEGPPALSQVNGRLEFTETGVSVPGATAQLLGGPVNISATTRKDGQIVVNAQGTLTAAGLRSYMDDPVTQHVQGTTPWQATLAIRKRDVDFTLASELRGLALDLPAPFDKTAAETRQLRVERVTLADGEAVKRGLRGGRGDAIAASFGRVLNAQLLRRLDGDALMVERGVIGLNENAALPARGVLLTGSLRNLDVDRWWALLPGEETAGMKIDNANLRISTLDLGGKRFNEVNLRAARQDEQWRATIGARELAGELTWRPEGKGVIEARLKHLAIPDNRPDADAEPSTRSDALPKVDLVAENFVTRDKKLGRLELLAENEGNDWRIQKLALSSPEGTLSAEGLWKSGTQQETSVNVTLEVNDIGKYLERFGYPDMVARGKASMDGRLSWAGGLQAIDYPSLSGTLSLKAEKGQFLKIEPGAGRLLGIISLQSWITLDIRDVVREGFAFDSISCNAVIARGVASTQNFKMRGPTAAVDITGETDLARETQNLRVDVVPALGDGVASVAVLLINPVIGISTWLAQKILQDPLGHIFAFSYAVTGSWADPKVEKIKTLVPVARTPEEARQ